MMRQRQRVQKQTGCLGRQRTLLLKGSAWSFVLFNWGLCFLSSHVMAFKDSWFFTMSRMGSWKRNEYAYELCSIKVNAQIHQGFKERGVLSIKSSTRLKTETSQRQTWTPWNFSKQDRQSCDWKRYLNKITPNFPFVLNICIMVQKFQKRSPLWGGESGFCLFVCLF